MLSAQDIRQFFRLSRPINLLIAWLTFALAAYISDYGRWQLLENPHFWAEGGLILAVMATGYWINDVYDFRIDRINKPARTVVGAFLSTKKVITAYLVWVFLASGASLLLPLKYILLNLGAIAALWLYAHFFKRYAVVGNLVVATLTALVVLAGALLYTLRLPLLWMIGFAFLVTLVREVVKDVEDLRGDMRYHLRTLPILLGIRGSKRVIGWLYILLSLATLAPFVTEGLLVRTLPWAYLVSVLVLVALPLVYMYVRLQAAARPTDFSWHSRRLKWVMLGGWVALLLLA